MIHIGKECHDKAKRKQSNPVVGGKYKFSLLLIAILLSSFDPAKGHSDKFDKSGLIDAVASLSFGRDPHRLA